MLPATFFLSFVSEYSNQGPLTITFVSDNEELISQCDVHLQYTMSFLNEIIKSEYDVTKQIFCTASKYNLNTSYH